MPTYEYRCLKCKKHFDKLQSFSEAPVKKCIHCKGKVERLISGGTGLIFKGSGFYITDYKKAGSGESKDKKDKAPESKKSDTKKP